MSGPFFEGDRALERLGDLTELIYGAAGKSGLDASELERVEELLGQMGDALRERDVKRAKKLVTTLLTLVLGYDETRARFVMYNHLNKNAGWD